MFFRRKELKLRELQVQDIFTISKIFINISSEAKEEIAEIIKENRPEPGSEKKERSEEETLNTGIKIAGILFKILLQYAEEDLKKFLADLSGLTINQFNKLPLSAMKDIITQLKDKPEINDFFSDAFSAYKTIDQSAEELMKK